MLANQVHRAAEPGERNGQYGRDLPHSGSERPSSRAWLRDFGRFLASIHSIIACQGSDEDFAK